MKRLIPFLLALFLLTGCDAIQPQSKVDPLVFGIFEPTTGIFGETGEETLRGAKLAQDIRPVALGKKIELKLYNTKSQSFEAANGVAYLSDRGAVGLIGTFGSDSMQMASPVINAAKIPTVTGSTSPKLKDNYWITQISVSDDEQARAMARFADETLHVKDVAIMIDSDTLYCNDLAYSFVRILPDYINVYKVFYHTGESRFHNEIQRLKKLPVDSVYCPGNSAASAYLVRAIRAEYPDTPIMGGDRWENPSFKALGKKAVEGVYFTAHYARYETFNIASDTFLSLYREKYGKEPTSYAAIGYDAYNLLYDAVVKGGKDDSATMAQYLRKQESFDGALGIKKRFTTRSVPILQQQGRRGNYVTSVEVSR